MFYPGVFCYIVLALGQTVGILWIFCGQVHRLVPELWFLDFSLVPGLPKYPMMALIIWYAGINLCEEVWGSRLAEVKHGSGLYPAGERLLMWDKTKLVFVPVGLHRTDRVVVHVCTSPGAVRIGAVFRHLLAAGSGGRGGHLRSGLVRVQTLPQGPNSSHLH